MRSLGDYAELIATKYLESLGHTVISRNYNCRFGEIDIITKFDSVIHFIEVKSVYRTNYHPYEQITKNKIKSLKKTMEFYILHNKLQNEYISFDILGIIFLNKENYKIEYEQNVFID